MEIGGRDEKVTGLQSSIDELVEALQAIRGVRNVVRPRTLALIRADALTSSPVSTACSK